MELGIGADHEAIAAADTAERLRIGLFAYAREGLTRQDLEAIAPVWLDGSAPVERLALCTDGVGVEALCEGRSLNAALAKAVKLGVPLPVAVRAATLVPATRFGLAPRLGAIRPGACADLVVTGDAETFRPELVLVGGKRPVAAPLSQADWMLDSVHPAQVPDGLLEKPGRGRWRAMRIFEEAPMVTREVESDGSDALVAVAVDRLGTDRAFRGLLLGLGLRSASVATTAGSDSRVVMLTGPRPTDMRLAMEEVTKMNGGAAVVRDGKVLAAWPARIGGMFSAEPCEVVAQGVEAINRALREDGCPLPNPLLTLEFLTSPAIPHLRICAEGYVRLRDGARLGLEW
jgi:adenine deaminase